ncbi:MAG: hypothetical protein EP297_13215 [Gammaproteobacteria bacterium]|nr:MAG: hypothetical protein EP297_13215 [Gammaproteobacteria bacterium]
MGRQAKVLARVACFVTAIGMVILPETFHAKEAKFVPLPVIENDQISLKAIYLENPRFPKFTVEDLRQVLDTAADLVAKHFDIEVKIPSRIKVQHIDGVFAELMGNEPDGFKALIGDFRNGKVDWEVVRENLVEQIKKQKEPLADQISFAEPYLTRPVETKDIDTFSKVVVETFKARLTHWTSAKLADGHPVIGTVPDRPDLPLNEYGYWTLMARQGIEAEIILTNQLVASVEYIPVPVHTSIRGGITGGSTEYNPESILGASVWVTLFPYVSNDPGILDLRNRDTYNRDEALYYAGAMLAHEMGHQLLQLGHPWSNPACLMRPAEALDFAIWVKKFDADKCRIGSSPAMQPGTVKPPIW